MNPKSPQRRIGREGYLPELRSVTDSESGSDRGLDVGTPANEQQGRERSGSGLWRERYKEWIQVGGEQPIPFGDPLPEEELNYLSEKGFTFDLTPLGKGGYGTVWSVTASKLVKDSKGNYIDAIVACKVLSISKFKGVGVSVQESVRRLLAEGKVHNELNHKNVVKCEEIFYLKQKTTAFPYMRALIFMELCDGDLQKLMNTKPGKRLTEEEANEWFVQISRGLKYLHDLNVIHFDIKTINIMFSDSNTRVYKLADFGLTQKYSADDPTDTTPRGTKKYMPPELDTYSATVPEYRTKPVDIYCLGLCLAESVSGRGDMKTLIQDARHWTGAVRHKWGIGFEFAELVLQMINPDPQRRPTIHQILQNEWISAFGYQVYTQ